MKRTTILIILFSAIAYLGCKKLPAQEGSTDVTNGVFRVTVTADASYDVLITHLDSVKTTVLDSIDFHHTGTTQFDYGFSVKKGTKVNVQVVSPLATQLNCMIYYEGAELGPTVVNRTSQGLETNFSYTTTN